MTRKHATDAGSAPGEAARKAEPVAVTVADRAEPERPESVDVDTSGGGP